MLIKILKFYVVIYHMVSVLSDFSLYKERNKYPCDSDS
jgi:hypothetical protein